MTEVNAIARKWGDSLAIIIPKDIVEEEKIQPLDKIRFTIHKEYDLSDLFGKLKTKKTAQELKDESRSGWQ